MLYTGFNYFLMRNLFIALGVILLLVIGVGSYGMSTYNGLVASREAVSGQWAQVESQYQRRFDLVPNLVESVKGTMKQEQAVFGAIAEARTRYAGAQTVGDKATAASEYESAISRLLIVMEQYPQLKSIDTVTTLMSQLEGTENRIAVERQRFNQAAESYNVTIKRFPTSVIAGFGGFETVKYTKAQAEAETAPKVSF